MVDKRKEPEFCAGCAHERYCPNHEPDSRCGQNGICEQCGEDHDAYWDCYNGMDARDGDAWGGFTGRSGG